ncbi:MAG: ATP-binding protein [Bacteroidales bacterium]|nr:ATP-binding protein [Clostridium sp.]MCM1204521.1 ATP-binding protein [Bacteroidales bacterium]
MSEQTKIDHSLIEYLLSVPDIFQDDDTKIDYAENEYPDAANTAPDAFRIQTAYQIKKFIDEIPGGFFIYHADEKEELIYVNHALIRMFNCDSRKEFQELTGNTFKGIVHPDDFEAVEQSIREQITNSQYDLDYVEYRIIQKGGEIRWIDDYGHFVHSDAAGDIFYVFVGDATEKKLRQQELTNAILADTAQKEQKLINRIEEYDKELETVNQEQLRRLEVIEALSLNYESIFYVDLDKNQVRPYRTSDRIEYHFRHNVQTCEFIGFASDYIRQWVHPDDRKLLSQANTPEYIQERLSDTGTFHINYRILKNGETKYLQLHVVNVGNEEHISQIVMGYRSVDDEIIHEMEQTKILQAALEQATLANNAKNTFLSNMSHDIRTPLNAIVGFTTLAQNHMNNQEKVKDYLDKIEASSGQLLHVLNDILEISRIESGKLQLEETICNLPELIKTVYQNTLDRASLKNIAFSFDVSGLTHSDAYCDQTRLKQILTRFISNAIKYTRPGGKIAITATELRQDSNEYATYRFTVKDNGIGIGESFLAQIFEPFEREKNTTLSGVPGTGLGLTIARNLADLMGGTITVESAAGKGSTFAVTFNFRIQHGKPASPRPELHKVNDDTEPKRILIVEDNEINREIEIELLQDAGYLVDTAENGSIAVDKLKQAAPGYYHLVLMDIQMPVMNGYQAAQAIRNMDNPLLADIPIIALSANTFDEDKRMSLESGMNTHMEKPIDTPQLLDVIYRLTREYHSLLLPS